MKKRLLLILILIVAGALPAHAGPTLGELWFKVQKSLNAKDVESLRSNVAGVEKRARQLGVRHLTPYARALAAWAAHEPGKIGDVAARLARGLDPGEPSVWFVLARQAWSDGKYGSAVISYGRGWLTAVTNALSRREVLGSLVPFLLMALGGVLFVGVLLIAAQFFTRMYHDAHELGSIIFKGPDAAVFAVVIVTLPIFAGLGPVWLVAYIFALTFPYLQGKQRVTSAVVWVLLLCIVPCLNVWEHSGLRDLPLSRRVVASLQDKRLDPAMVQEFAGLEPKLKKNAEYHLLLGDVFRLHDDAPSARVQFQKAAVEAPGDPRPLIFLGNLAFNEGNLPGAIQSYSLAMKRNPAEPLAYYDLSLALDQSYRFQEADRMRSKARQLGGERFKQIIGDGPAAMPVDPLVGEHDMQRLLTAIPRSELVSLGMIPGSMWSWKWPFQSLSLVILVTGLLGVIVALMRKRWMWTARACTRCGKVFCPRCHGASESEAYCSQCVSVFLKRDQVAIEQQAAKLDQIRKRQQRMTWTCRILSLIIPGGGMVVKGRWEIGLLWSFVAIASGFLALGWLPQVLAEIEPQGSIVPAQIVLIVILALSWFHTIRASWGGV